MFKLRLTPYAAALALVAASSVHAAADVELAEIREQIRQLKEGYEARIRALEERVRRAEAAAAKAERSALDVRATAAQAEGAAARAEGSAAKAEAAASASAGSASESAFNPAVSLILQGSYNRFSQDPDRYRTGGFLPAGGEGLGQKGLSVGESELTIAANIDPRFRGTFTAAIAPDDSIEVEEAFFETLGLSHGLNVKGGRFFSGIGYLNEIHQHAWDFVDAPLAYRAFLGTGARGNFGDDGIQVRWVAPTDTFLEIGGEATRGRGFPGSNRDRNGVGLATVYAHAGGDVGASHSWRAGLSFLRTRARDRAYEDFDSLGGAVVNAFSGKSRLWIADLVWKWSPEGNAGRTSVKLQGEYFIRREDGSLTFDANGTSAVSTGPSNGAYSSRQSGWYLQGVYQFMPSWRVGARHDRLASGTADIGLVSSGVLGSIDFPLLRERNPSRSSVMIDYSASEFSRLRLQWSRDGSRDDAVKDNQVLLQYVHSLGAHGGHKF